MKLNLVQIGNSWGIRIPKALLQQCNIKKTVTAVVVDGNLLICTDDSPRAGWEDAFKKMAAAGDDKLFDEAQSTSSFDKDEWEW